MESEHGRGIGRMMINHIIDLAKFQGINVIQLHTHRDLKAYDIYHHMGFEDQKDESVYMKKWFL